MSDKLSFTHRFVKGMPRFFRRHAEGVLDEEDVRRRTHELADFIALTAR